MAASVSSVLAHIQSFSFLKLYFPFWADEYELLNVMVMTLEQVKVFRMTSCVNLSIKFEQACLLL